MATIINPYRFAAGGGDFDPASDITWHSLWWAEGTNFVSQGYSDTDEITSWANETSEVDLVEYLVNATVWANYNASNSNFNNQPTVDWNTSVSGALQTNSTGGDDFTSSPSYASKCSFVFIARQTVAASTTTSIMDGADSGGRNVFGTSGGAWRMFGGGSVKTGGTGDTSTHLFVAQWDGSTGNDTLDVDGTNAISADSGSGTVTGLHVGAANNNSSNASKPEIALFGVYEGDFTADSEYANFTSWAGTHYGLTIA